MFKRRRRQVLKIRRQGRVCFSNAPAAFVPQPRGYSESFHEQAGMAGPVTVEADFQYFSLEPIS